MTNNLGTSEYTIGGDYDAWGDKFVADMAILNKFAGDTLVVADTSGDVILTVEQCQNFAIKATGAGGTTVNVRVPDSIKRYWYVENARASGSITVRCATGGTAVTLAAGEKGIVRSDGTDCGNLALATLAIASVVGLQAALDAKAGLASPVFTGNPTAPTPSPGDNDTSIATTGFVKAAIDVVLGGVAAAGDTLAELYSLIQSLTSDVAAKLAKASNLSDLADATTARTNLGLGSAAVLAETSSAEYRANTADRALSTDQVWGAAAEVTLTDATTIAVDMSTFINAKVTLGGNRTLGQPSNTKDQSGHIRIIQDGTGGRTLAFHSDWKFANGQDPVVSSAPGATDVLYYKVLAPNVIHAVLSRAIS